MFGSTRIWRIKNNLFLCVLYNVHLRVFPKKEELGARGRWQVRKVNTREEVAWKNKEGKGKGLVARCGALAVRRVSFQPWRKGLAAVEPSSS